ncbi:hypothetical protein P8H26_13380 [Pseudochrobactrum sp. sp1633]|uniref:hypothetical protein n=1 Tax=Pseudochrobactrum sp. sp1633 TaxID=3036706 RepID=UPI0025A4F129|nr:hypothetical protein [Pseudochrobactrum sp. sp1633]MDM8346384.1 hypothetical protein [Pseudochrobactrum sp. sp1633]HWD14221.1 hypothetical protein [Pseudochrobactrum sp.]
MLKTYKGIRQLISAGVITCTAIAFIYSNQFAALKLALNWWDPFAISHYRLSALTTDEFISEIQSALDEDDIAEAQNLVTLATDYGHTLPQELVANTEEGYLAATYRYSSGFVNGFIYGEVDSVNTLLGSLASDYVGYGDLRDISTEGTKFVTGESYDAITLGIAAVGLSTSVVTWSSKIASLNPINAPVTVPVALAAAQADKGASLIKGAYKTRKLSRPLIEKITAVSSKLINKPALTKALTSPEPLYKIPSLSKMTTAAKNIDYKKLLKGDFTDSETILYEASPLDLAALGKRFDGVINTSAVKELDDLVSASGKLLSSAGVSTSMRALAYADDAKDLRKFAKLSDKFAEKTSSVIKLLGKNAIRLGKLLYLVISILISVAIWLAWAIWLVYSLSKSTYRIIARKKKRVAHEAL